jgi:hypothetical protein
MQTERGSESESDDEYLDSVADPADLEERSRSSDRASRQTLLDTESGRGRAVSDGLGPTPDAGSVGARCRAHVPEQPGQTDAKEREVTPTDARFRHVYTTLPVNAVHCTITESYFTDHKPLLCSIMI